MANGTADPLQILMWMQMMQRMNAANAPQQDNTAARGWMGYAEDAAPWAALGLGGASDILGAIQRAEQQRQQQQAYRSQRQLFALLTDPKQFSQYVQGIYQPMSEAERQATSRSLAADRAGRGETSGGALDQFIADAFAKMGSDRYTNAAMIALRALTGGVPNLTRATPATTLPSGNPLGGTAGALQMLAQLRAIRDRQPGITMPSGDLPTGSVKGVDEIPQLTDFATV